MKQSILKGWVQAFLLGLIVFFAPLADAELEKVEEEETEIIVVDDEVPVMVEKLPKAKKVFKKKKKSKESKAPRVIVIRQAEPAATPAVAAVSTMVPEPAPEPIPETFGQKLSKKIDAKLDADREVREEKMRREEAERQANLLERIDSALTGEEKPAQPQQTQVVEPTFSTIEDVEAQHNSGVSSREVPSGNAQFNASQSVEQEVETPFGGSSGLSISPNIGISNLDADSYNVDAGSALGVQIGYELNDNVVFNFGYTYNQYEISLLESGFTFNSFNNQFGFNDFFDNSLNELEYKQNVFDAGMRYLVFDSSSKLRPYFGGGVSYAIGYLNYKQKALDTFSQSSFFRNSNALDDYELTGFSGYLQAGAILNFSKQFGIGANFKYHTILSSAEEAPIQNQFGFAMNGDLNANQIANDRSIVGGTLADANWTTLDLSLMLSF